MQNQILGDVIVIAGEESVRAARLLILKGALTLESKGLKLSRGRSALAVVKAEFGFKGTAKTVLPQFIAKLKELGILQDDSTERSLTA